jgi:hypothetical protein
MSTTTYRPQIGDRVEHRAYAAWGVGIVTGRAANPYLPSQPGRCTVEFGNFERDLPDEALKPATRAFVPLRVIGADDGASAA